MLVIVPHCSASHECAENNELIHCVMCHDTYGNTVPFLLLIVPVHRLELVVCKTTTGTCPAVFGLAGPSFTLFNQWEAACAHATHVHRCTASVSTYTVHWVYVRTVRLPLLLCVVLVMNLYLLPPSPHTPTSPLFLPTHLHPLSSSPHTYIPSPPHTPIYAPSHPPSPPSSPPLPPPPLPFTHCSRTRKPRRKSC